MLAILQQLRNTYGINLPSGYSEGQIASIFQQPISINISKLVDDHKWVAIQYSLYCAQIIKELEDEPNGEILTELTQRIETALLMAELLEQLYARYLNEIDQIARMHRDQGEYRKILRDRGLRSISLFDKTRENSYSKDIHENISAANRLRLFTLRVRRLLIVTTPLLEYYERYCRFINWMEECTGPAVAYLAWMTLFPRLLKNLFLLGKHLAPVSLWMSEEELSLDTITRLNAQLELHWFELANDIVTISVGLLNCFVLTGAASTYLGVGLLAFDVVLATWRAHYELQRLDEIKKTYEQMEPADLDYLNYLNKRIRYEELRHEFAMTNTALLLFAATLTLPIITSLNIMIPMIGAALAVLTTIANIIACQHIESEDYKPVDKVVYTPRLFAPAPVTVLALELVPMAQHIYPDLLSRNSNQSKGLDLDQEQKPSIVFNA